MKSKEYSKKNYSEWVIRNSLYWFSNYSKWSLEESEEFWSVSIQEDEESAIQELDRLINDYLLREKIMKKTEGVREKIALKVLQSIEEKIK
jgi:His-Xaa-Ser system protein HxsD